MGKFIFWGFMFIAGIGIWYGNSWYYDIPENIILLCLGVIIFSSIIAIIHANYVLHLSKNMNEVERYLGKLKKRAYFSALIDMLDGDFETAEKKLDRIQGRRQRATLEVILHIERKNIDEAIEAAKQILEPSIRYTYFAVIAMLQNDWSAYEIMKNKIKRKNLLYALEADASYRKGDLEQAKVFGDLAISTSSGLQRFTYIKLLERQENNPNRESYF